MHPNDSQEAGSCSSTTSPTNDPSPSLFPTNRKQPNPAQMGNTAPRQLAGTQPTPSAHVPNQNHLICSGTGPLKEVTSHSAAKRKNDRLDKTAVPLRVYGLTAWEMRGRKGEFWGRELGPPANPPWHVALAAITCLQEDCGAWKACWDACVVSLWLGAIGSMVFPQSRQLASKRFCILLSVGYSVI